MQVKVCDPDENVISLTNYSYDGLGNRTQVSQGGGTAVTESGYNALSQMIWQTVGFGSSAAATTTYMYDANGYLAKVTDPDGNVTTFTNDSLGNVLVKTTPLGTWTFTYGGMNNILTSLDPNGRLTTYVYDGAGNLKQQNMYAGSTLSSTLTDSNAYTYDANGNMKTASNSAGTYTFTYIGNRLRTVTEPTGVTLTFGYDGLGDRTSMTDTLGNSETSVYNAAGQLTNETLVSAGTTLIVAMQYDGNGNVWKVQRYNGEEGTGSVATETRGYNAANQLTSITDVGPAPANTLLEAYVYAYNTAGQLSREVDNGVVIDYTYDGAGQLKTAGATTDNFDLNGNPANSGDALVPVAQPDNELQTDGTWNFSYDADGNLTGKVNIATGETWTYGYNNANQMISAVNKTSPGGTLISDTVYTYDAFGNCIGQSVTTPSGTTVTDYVLDGFNPALAGATGNSGWNVLADINSGGTLETAYLWGNAVSQLFARIGADGTGAFTLTDHLGSVIGVTDANGTLEDQIGYDVYGNILNQSNSAWTGRYTYATMQYSGTTGLYQTAARFYNPQIGQWQSQDPLGYDAGDSNLYRYVNNSPTNATDPSGMSSVSAQSLPNGTEHLYYIGTHFGFWSNESVYIGTYNPHTGLVVRGGRAVPYQKVKNAAEAWGFGMPNWNEFFADNAVPDRPGQTEAIVLRDQMLAQYSQDGRGQDFRNDAVVATGQINLLANVGIAWTATAGMFVSASAAAESLSRALPGGHVFDRHAFEWFGLESNAAFRPSEAQVRSWLNVIETVGRSHNTFEWSVRNFPTVAHIARVDGKWFVVQFFKDTGVLASAFIPQGTQLQNMLRAAALIP